MTQSELITENIENLTSLWLLVSEPFDGVHTYPDFTYCEVPNSEWPNRLWFHGEVNQQMLTKAKECYFNSRENNALSYFDIPGNKEGDLFVKNGFAIKSEQIGMAFRPSDYLRLSHKISFEPITNKKEATLWAQLFYESFQYKIDSAQALLALDRTHFYFISNDAKERVGTVLLHSINTEVLGVHSFGVIPKYRRQGNATGAMRFVINHALEYGFSYVVLQSSQMALGLYEKLGFQKQFVMKNSSFTKSFDPEKSF